MSPAQPHVVIFSPDTELFRRAGAYIIRSATLRHASTAKDLDRLLRSIGNCVLFVDTRDREAVEAIPGLMQQWPTMAIIALGEPRSDMLQTAESFGVYACEDIHASGQRFQALVQRAALHLQTQQENEILRQEAAQQMTTLQQTYAPAKEFSRQQPRLQLRQFSQALRRFDKAEALFEAIVDTVSTSINVSRAGLFCKTRDSNSYRLRAGIRCLEETQALEYDTRHPLVRWMEVHAHLVARNNIDHVRTPAERQMLRQTLDAMGAEIMIPLLARGQVLGWLFIGHRATGIPFDLADLEDLTVLADHVSTLLENALLYEEVAVQKTLAETLLHSMPTGIVAVGMNGVIRWFNSAAQKILDVAPNKVLNQPAKVLGSRLADLLHRTIHSENIDQPTEWTDQQTHRYISAQAHRLMNGEVCLGAVALIHDLTIERMLEEKREQLERTAFWTELAASMSHEIRNPLVAIKTFAQLLPDRYNDPDFRGDFSGMVSKEVDRLNGIIEQINAFAHPPELQFHPISIREAVLRGLNMAQSQYGRSSARVENLVPEHLPQVTGDESAIGECIAHLVQNAMEALEGRNDGKIDISARRLEELNQKPQILLTIKDNGPGIPADIRDKIFSPFCTTKPRGMGLGLPIAKRTIVDHNGSIEVESNDRGTTVSILLPSTNRVAEETEVQHETHTDR